MKTSQLLEKKILFKRRGFTLVELLVVIFIIGLLVGVGAVAALNVRKKGRDAAIQTTLYQVRIEATIIKNKTELNSYATLCDPAPFGDDTLNDGAYDNLRVIETEVKKYTPPGFDPNNYPECYADIDRYCVQFPLNTEGTYCLDSTGYAGTIANCSAGNISCQ